MKNLPLSVSVLFCLFLSSQLFAQKVTLKKMPWNDILNAEIELVECGTVKNIESDTLETLESENQFTGEQSSDSNGIRAFTPEIEAFMRGVKIGGDTKLTGEKPYFWEKNPSFIPVFFEDNPNGKGALIVTKMRRFSAENFKLKKRDLLISINGIKISNRKEVFDFFRKYKNNEPVNLEILRKQRLITIQNQQLIELPFEHSRQNYNYDNPCQVFIGIQQSMGYKGEGVRVSRVFENTAAEKMGLQKGDLIIKMDGREIITQPELLDEREGNRAGDYFMLTVFRNGKRKKLKGQFMPCQELAEAKEEKSSSEYFESIGNEFSVFPNPTKGLFFVKLKTDNSLPVSISVTNAIGKLVFSKRTDGLSGNMIYEKLSLKGQAAGTYFISVSQSDRIFTEKVILE